MRIKYKTIIRFNLIISYVSSVVIDLVLGIKNLGLKEKGYYKVIPQPYSHMVAVVALFVPMPIIMEDPMFAIKDYGFGFAMSFGKFIPLGWIMILVSLIF